MNTENSAHGYSEGADVPFKKLTAYTEEGNTIATDSTDLNRQPKYFLQYDEMRNKFEVFEVELRHENGSPHRSGRIAVCDEESDANKIIKALNQFKDNGN